MAIILFPCSGKDNPEIVLKKYIEYMFLSSKSLINFISDLDIPYFDYENVYLESKLLFDWIKKYLIIEITNKELSENKAIISGKITEPNFWFDNYDLQEYIEGKEELTDYEKKEMYAKKIIEKYNNIDPPLITYKFKYTLLLENGEWKIFLNLKEKREREIEREKKTELFRKEYLKNIKIEIKELYKYEFDSNLRISLLVKNNGKYIVDDLKVKIEYFDSSNELIGDEITSLWIHDLKPNYEVDCILFQETDFNPPSNTKNISIIPIEVKFPYNFEYPID